VSRHILLQLPGSLMLPQAGQVTGEVARRDEGFRVVLAQHPATAGRLSSSIRRASMYSTASARLLAVPIAHARAITVLADRSGTVLINGTH